MISSGVFLGCMLLKPCLVLGFFGGVFFIYVNRWGGCVGLTGYWGGGVFGFGLGGEFRRVRVGVRVAMKIEVKVRIEWMRVMCDLVFCWGSGSRGFYELFYSFYGVCLFRCRGAVVRYVGCGWGGWLRWVWRGCGYGGEGCVEGF